MNVFIDTNIVIDFYQKREPFYTEAEALFQLALDREIRMLVSSTTLINSFYLLKKFYPRDLLYKKMRDLFMLVSVCDVTAENVASALAAEWQDFEDCIQYISATSSNADVIITRNKKDYVNSSIPVQLPLEFLEQQ